MDELNKAILRTVAEHNTDGEMIYLKKLTVLFDGRSAPSTMQSRVRQLVKEGELSEVVVIGKRGMYKHLFIPSPDSEATGCDRPSELKIIDNRQTLEMGKKIDMIMTFFGISDAVCEGIRRQRDR